MKKNYELNTIIRYGIIAIVLVLSYLLFRRLSGVLVPFIVSWFIAYMLCPLVNFFQIKCRFKNRALSVVTAMLVLLIVLAGFNLCVVPPMMAEMAHLSNYVTTHIANFNASDYLPQEIVDQYLNRQSEFNWLALLQNEDVVSAAKVAAPKLWQMITSGVNAITKLGIVMMCILYIFFLLLDWEQLDKEMIKMVPEKHRRHVTMVLTDVSNNMQAYFRNQGLVATVVGVIFAVGFEIIGLPLGIVMGILIGIMSMVPYLKALGVVPCLLLAVLQSAETGRPLWIILLCMIGVFLFAQFMDDFVLTPKIMGKAMGLHPAIILLALSIWGSLLGVVGMLIALPLTTVLLTYYKRYVIKQDPELDA
ncbi:MAG: AI-2E family transporter [Paludibacteraceae bacterium]|nr:AI-2E family transporter [Paludibacteraceae bacterium]